MKTATLSRKRPTNPRSLFSFPAIEGGDPAWEIMILLSSKMNKSRRTLYRLFVFSIATVFFASYATADELKSSAGNGKPNIIVFFLDDSGYGDYAHNGNPTIRTPNISKLAQDGMNFTQFYVTSPACSASRYSLLTGRYPGRSGLGSWVDRARCQTTPSPQRNHPR